MNPPQKPQDQQATAPGPSNPYESLAQPQQAQIGGSAPTAAQPMAGTPYTPPASNKGIGANASQAGGPSASNVKAQPSAQPTGTQAQTTPGKGTAGQSSGLTGTSTPQYQAPATMQETGPTATGFVNFGDMYNANAAVSQQQANQRMQAIQQQVQQAGKDAAGGVTPANTNAYSKLAEDTTAAEQAVNNPLTGMNQTDAALIGTAGRPGFAALQSKYGDLSNQLAPKSVSSPQGNVAGGNAYEGLAKEAASPVGQQSYNPATDDHMDHSLDDTRTANQQGYNAIGTQMGFTNPDGTALSGAAWLAQLPRLEQAGGNDPSGYGAQLKNNIANAAKALGMSDTDFTSMMSKMSARELGDFWAMGVVPQWAGGNGQIGGWNDPMIQQMAQYGNDGGMWSAILNQWKGGAQNVAAAIPFVGGAASQAIGQVKVGDSRLDKFKQGNTNG